MIRLSASTSKTILRADLDTVYYSSMITMVRLMSTILVNRGLEEQNHYEEC